MGEHAGKETCGWAGQTLPPHPGPAEQGMVADAGTAGRAAGHRPCRQRCGKAAARSGADSVAGMAMSLAISLGEELGAQSREHVKGDPTVSPGKMLIYVFLQLRHLLFCHDRPSQQLASLLLQILLEGQRIMEKTESSVRWE